MTGTPGADVEGYGAADTARWAPEPAPRPERTAFARDRARVLHCSALRRLAAKTQVLQAGQSDVPRTRLTHTLEVAQVARELGAALGCAADLVDTAGLAHDLGHPPFGHNGEAELDRLAAPAGGFEGNAQSLRVLTRLEAKTFAGGRSVGLNLTRASLDATAKYPWPRRPGSAKFGVYADDADVFAWARAGAPEGRRCAEAQVMDWADDVAYSVHDVEDALLLGHLDLAALRSAPERADLAALARAWYAPDSGPDELLAALDRLLGLDCWPAAFDGSQRALAAVKNMTSGLIGRFCAAAQAATRARHGPAPLRRYAGDLEVPRATREEVAVLKATAARYVMLRAGADAVYARQREVVAGLVGALVPAGPGALEPWLRPAWEQAGDDAGRLRVVVDQVASLTDTSVLDWHARRCGRG